MTYFEYSRRTQVRAYLQFVLSILTNVPDADDLNALYVYEAKMSLFVRMTQSRAGAERLLEARIIPVLSSCDFPDIRPEADQAFIGQCCSKWCQCLQTLKGTCM